MKKNISFLALGIFLVGCKGDSSGEADKSLNKDLGSAESTLQPIKLGAKWIYELETNPKGTIQDVKFEIVSVQSCSEGKEIQWKISDIKTGKIIDQPIWIVGKGGLFQKSFGVVPTVYGSLKPLAPFPLKPRNTFQWKGNSMTSYGMRDVRMQGKVLGWQEVDAVEARYVAVAVDLQEDSGDGNNKETSVSNTWWAPGIGLVRLRQLIGGSNGKVFEQIYRLKRVENIK